MAIQKCTLKRNRESELEQAIADLEERGYKVVKRGFREGDPYVKLKINHGNKLGERRESVFSPFNETTDIVKEFHWANMERSEEDFSKCLSSMK